MCVIKCIRKREREFVWVYKHACLNVCVCERECVSQTGRQVISAQILRSRLLEAIEGEKGRGSGKSLQKQRTFVTKETKKTKKT